jgi:hypothetical protein
VSRLRISGAIPPLSNDAMVYARITFTCASRFPNGKKNDLDTKRIQSFTTFERHAQDVCNGQELAYAGTGENFYMAKCRKVLCDSYAAFQLHARKAKNLNSIA